MAVMAICATVAFAYDSLIPVGKTVGIRMTVDGILVDDFKDVETSRGVCSPAKDSGLKKGDLIRSVDGKTLSSASDFVKSVAQSGGRMLDLTVIRDRNEISLSLTPVADVGGQFRAGLIIRDEIDGIGTVTYFDPSTGDFGALGHGICDKNGNTIPSTDGELIASDVASVEQGRVGIPGSLIGEFYPDKIIGDLDRNSEAGIFGTINSDCFEGTPMELGEPTEGEVTIMCCVKGNETKQYRAEIVKITGDDTRNFILRVTDGELLAITGGIVQGMSGSPILQDGKLVGAVTHVFINDPTSGYGISIEKMTSFVSESRHAA